MADLSKPKKPEYKRGSAQSPNQQQIAYGGATDLNVASPPFPDLESTRPADSGSGPEPLLGGEFDTALFQPTHRPDEPITTGVPVGPGANVVKNDFTGESDKETLSRYAQTLLPSPILTSRSKAFLARIARGE